MGSQPSEGSAVGVLRGQVRAGAREKCHGVDVGDECVGLQALRAVDLHRFDKAAFFDEPGHCRAGADLAVDLGDEAVDYRRAASFKAVAAVDEGVADLGEDIEREALTGELQLERSAGKDLLKQRIIGARDGGPGDREDGEEEKEGDGDSDDGR